MAELIPIAPDPVDDAFPRCPECHEQLVDPGGPVSADVVLWCPRCEREWRAEEIV